MKIIYLKEDLFDESELYEQQIFPKWRKKMSYADYYITDEEESYFYDLIKTNVSNLPVDILIDTDKAYKRHGHPLWLYFKNGTENDYEWIPIVINDHPYMPYHVKLKIRRKEYNALLKFITTYRKTLKEIANKEEDIYLLMDLKDYQQTNFLTEGLIYYDNFNIEYLNEMSTFTSDMTGLPVDIWIDHTGSYKKSGHFYRMKFEYPKGNKITKSWPTITIPDKELVGATINEIGNSLFKKLSTFIDYNKDLLKNIAENNLTRKEIISQIIKLDKNGNPIPKGQEYEIIFNDNYGFVMIKDKTTGLYNFQDDEGKLLANYWFTTAKPFKLDRKNNLFSFVTIKNKKYILYSDGQLQKLDC